MFLADHFGEGSGAHSDGEGLPFCFVGMGAVVAVVGVDMDIGSCK